MSIPIRSALPPHPPALLLLLLLLPPARTTPTPPAVYARTTPAAPAGSFASLLPSPGDPPQSPLGEPKTKPARARRCTPTGCCVTCLGILLAPRRYLRCVSMRYRRARRDAHHETPYEYVCIYTYIYLRVHVYAGVCACTCARARVCVYTHVGGASERGGSESRRRDEARHQHPPQEREVTLRRHSEALAHQIPRSSDRKLVRPVHSSPLTRHWQRVSKTRRRDRQTREDDARYRRVTARRSAREPQGSNVSHHSKALALLQSGGCDGAVVGTPRLFSRTSRAREGEATRGRATSKWRKRIVGPSVGRRDDEKEKGTRAARELRARYPRRE